MVDSVSPGRLGAIPDGLPVPPTPRAAAGRVGDAEPRPPRAQARTCAVVGSGPAIPPSVPSAASPSPGTRRPTSNLGPRPLVRRGEPAVGPLLRKGTVLADTIGTSGQRTCTSASPSSSGPGRRCGERSSSEYRSSTTTAARGSAARSRAGTADAPVEQRPGEVGDALALDGGDEPAVDDDAVVAHRQGPACGRHRPAGEGPRVALARVDEDLQVRQPGGPRRRRPDVGPGLLAHRARLPEDDVAGRAPS